jgi:hypothetical protein
MYIHKKSSLPDGFFLLKRCAFFTDSSASERKIA